MFWPIIEFSGVYACQFFFNLIVFEHTFAAGRWLPARIFDQKSEVQIMHERRKGERFVVSFPIRVKWKGVDGKEVEQEGLTENIGPHGTLVYLPRQLPTVGGKVNLTVI